MKRDNRVIFLFVVFLLVLASAFAYYSVPSDHITALFFNPGQGMEYRSKKTIPRPKASSRDWPAVQADKKIAVAKTKKESSKELKISKEVIAGWVTITNPWGRETNKFRAGLAGNGWLALPAISCLGGNTWYFESDSGWAEKISGGLWIKGDKVGLWHIANAPGIFDGLELGPWDKTKLVSWKSIESANEHNLIELYPGLTDGFFVSARLPGNIDESGVFIQNDKIVGWSFAESVTGYMWPGNAEEPLKDRTLVKYFYDITFANGREEQFSRALFMHESDTGLFQLAAFMKGFGLQPKLPLEDTPDHLLPEEIIKRMRILITKAISRDEGSKVIDMFSSQTLTQIGDISLFLDLVPVMAVLNGFEAAIIEIEDTGKYFNRQLGQDVPALNTLHLNYYQDWLESVVSDGKAYEGLQIYAAAKDYYPDDPEIHLRGVDLMLLNGDWEEAERLLYMRDYPFDFQMRVQFLARSISEMKGVEGKIVIQFPPGSSRVMVKAAMNERLYQNFLVDTGATTVTIPSSAAEALGLDVVYDNYIISTVGGPVEAGEVVLDAIEIGGWVEYDVRAFVIDIPGQPGLGLLGLNYLGRFQMDLRPEEGTLLLAPR